MTDTLPTHPGQVNGAGATDALFLKQWSGEILTAFDEVAETKGKIMERTITNGKTATFPGTGVAKAKYHTQGENILDASNGYLSTIKHAERTISIDAELLSTVFLSSLDEAMNYFDVRSEYTKQLSSELARQYDLRNYQVIVKAARTSKLITDTAGYRSLPGGTVINAGATVATDASVLAGAIFKAAETLDNNSVKGDRYCALSPALYYLIIQNLDAINKDWNGAGSYADGKVLRIAGIEIVKSIHLPKTVVAADPLESNDYSGDYTKTTAVVWTREAAGVLKLKDIKVESEYKMELRGTAIVASYALGHGVLRPECSVEISANAP